MILELFKNKKKGVFFIKNKFYFFFCEKIILKKKINFFY
jgi:hypothetical protein